MSKKISLKSNFIYNVCFQILKIVLPFITAPYVTRVLGKDCLGVYSTSNAFANYFYIFAMLGLEKYGNRIISIKRDSRDDLNRTFCEIYSVQFLLGILMSALYLGYCFVFVNENRIIYIMQVFYVLTSVFDVNWFLFGLEQFKMASVRSMVIRILIVVMTFVFVKDKNDLWKYTLILAGGMTVSSVVLWPYVFKTVKFVRPTAAGILSHLKPNLVLFLPVIAISLYNIMDKIMLGVISVDSEVAFYSYAESIVQMPNTVILALGTVMFPRMSYLYEKKEFAKAKEYMDNVMMFAMFAGTAMSLGLACVGKDFAVWFYGNEFERCGLFIVLLSPVIIFKAWAGTLRTQYLIPMKKDKIYIISLFSGAFVNLVLNYILIKRISGVGAIIGTLAAEFLVLFIQFFMIRKEISAKKYLIDGFGFIVVGLIMYAVVSIIPDIGDSMFMMLIVRVISGAVLYLSGSFIYMIIIRRNPVIVNYVLKTLHIKKRF